MPRRDLFKGKGYLPITLMQYSRGCPFRCEFCDIIVIYGRKPRVKEPEQLVAELDDMRQAGFHSAFIVDDNFIGKRSKARALLEALIEWRDRCRVRMRFLTEATITLADDPVLLPLMVRAGFYKVFLGIETPELESLRECHKMQNTRSDLVESIRRIQAAGLEVMGGFIVGFDEDTEDIFDRQIAFIRDAGIPMAMIGILILIGVVVNNGIVLIDHVNQLRLQGLSREDALLRAGEERLRPILMTVGTTVLGLTPLCIGTTQIGGDGPPYYPMARAIVGGLLFSTFVSLVLLPTIYTWLDIIRHWPAALGRAAMRGLLASARTLGRVLPRLKTAR